MALLLVVTLVAGTVLAVVTVRRPLPETSGEVQLSGLSGEVSVLRDDQGVPQIYADTAEDLFRAQGFVHAQDRFFEMDYRRHVTSGRIAELVGDNPAAIAGDKVIRTFGWRRVAEQEWAILDAETKTYLQAYAEGVNAYLAERSPGELGFEYTVLDVTVSVDDPEPWDPIDSLAWLKAMAWDLRGNYDHELDRARAYSTLQDAERVDELFPAYPFDVNVPIIDADEADAQQVDRQVEPASGFGEALESDALHEAIEAADRALASTPVLVGRGEGTGSNSFVVSGEHTASGLPLLANDPHLSLGAPSIWAQVGLHCNVVGPECPFDVAGFSFAGYPGVIIGHNADLAWGLTNMGADVTDFFIERVRSGATLRGDEWVPLETRTETIEVNGGDDVLLEVQSTVHGPIVSTVLDLDEIKDAPREGFEFGELAVSLQWTALEPGRTADAIFAFNRAADAEDVRAAAALFEVPAQNIVFATTDGQIGYQAPGKIPVRRDVEGPVPSDGTWPRPGWDERYDWDGFVDPDDMPRVVDPAEGFIVAANQAVLPEGAGPHLTRDWDYGYRSQRIRALIEDEIRGGRPLDTDAMNEIMLDDWNPYAEILVPLLLEQDVEDDFAADGQELLADWDYTTDTDSAAAAYFAAVWRNLLRTTFWDELPADAYPSGGSRWLAVVQGLLDDPEDPFWDDRSTVSVLETRDEALLQALVSARLDLTVELGKNTSDWEWGTLHVLELEHPVLGGDGIPALVRDYVNPDAVGMPGGSSIVNATAWDAASGSFAVTAGPSMRMVVDLGSLDDSTWVTVTGVSGHPGSPHYDDQLDAWAEGRTFDWPFSPAAVADASSDELRLVP